MTQPRGKFLKGRGTSSKVDARFLEHRRHEVDDGWTPEPGEETVATQIFQETARTIITRNQSPDIPFEASINAYRGCEHGCVYCYARPSHAYMDLSPGIDFETKIFTKTNAAELLQNELGNSRYVCKPIAMGTNTDPYQPIERQLHITRDIIQVLHDCQHPLSIVTKSWLIERDLDLLQPMAARGLVKVHLSITSLRHDLARRLEPRAASPSRRLKALENLNCAGVPAGVMFAPVIPFINDSEMETVLERAAAAGAVTAGYVILRLTRKWKPSWNGLRWPGLPRRDTSFCGCRTRSNNCFASGWRPMNRERRSMFSVSYGTRPEVRPGKRSRLFHPDARQRRVCRFGPKTVSKCLPEIRVKQRS